MARLDYTTSIYRSKTGRWIGEIRGPSVKRQRVVCSKKGDVRAKLIAERGNQPIQQPDMILRDWVSWWLENVNASKSPRNADHNKWALDQLGGITVKRLEDLEPMDVEAELARLAIRPRPNRRTRGTNKGRSAALHW